MLNKPTDSFINHTQSQRSNSNLSQKHNIQHGIQNRRNIRFPILVEIPVETLTGITSYLDPPSLLAVAQVNKHLNQHVNDDNTWRQAFVCQFMVISPETDLSDGKTLLLRPTESSWRNEFIVRCRFRRRWERSRTTTTSHVPVHSPMSGMLLMPSNGLLTSSLEYGIVSRSFPLSGKILSGYLDASGTRGELGIGNPNVEFTPNISACGMGADGGTAKIAWGSQAGDVLFLNAPKAMETGGRRSAAEVKRCSVADKHQGAVVDVVWLDVQGGWVVTGGTDARLKVWDAKSATSVWTSQQILDSVIPDPCVKVAGSTFYGYVVGVFKSGRIHVWTGFDFFRSTFSDENVQEITIDNPIRTSTEDYDPNIAHGVASLHVDSSCSHPSILVGYENDPYFYRIQIDTSTSDVQITAFGDPNFGATSTIVPCFRLDDKEQKQYSIVFVGDHLGCISLYDWDTDPNAANPRTNAVGPFRKLEAHPDGATVTAIVWDGLILASGSIRGETRIFDGISLELLRNFQSPIPRLRGGARTPPHFDGANEEEQERQRKEWERVRFILLGPEQDVLFVGIGDRVTGWKAGPVPKYFRGGVKGRSTAGWLKDRRTRGSARYLEMTQNIVESKHVMYDEAESSSHGSPAAYVSQRDQMAGLDALGLTEVEAVEYVLMLSRDEANNHARVEIEGHIDDAVFEGDFSDEGREHTLSNFNASPLLSSASSGSASSSRSSATTSPVLCGIRVGRPISALQSIGMPRASPSSLSSSNSSSNQKVRVSPPHQVEPMEAGEEWREGEPNANRVTETVERLDLENHYFPPMVGTARIGDSIRKNKHREEEEVLVNCNSEPSKAKPALTSSSAWSTPLTKRLANRDSSAATSFAPSPSSHSPNLSSERSSAAAVHGDSFDMDEEVLRFAIELSLAEAKSREVTRTA